MVVFHFPCNYSFQIAFAKASATFYLTVATTKQTESTQVLHYKTQAAERWCEEKIAKHLPGYMISFSFSPQPGKLSL